MAQSGAIGPGRELVVDAPCQDFSWDRPVTTSYQREIGLEIGGEVVASGRRRGVQTPCPPGSEKLETKEEKGASGYGML